MAYLPGLALPVSYSEANHINRILVSNKRTDSFALPGDWHGCFCGNSHPFLSKTVILAKYLPGHTPEVWTLQLVLNAVVSSHTTWGKISGTCNYCHKGLYYHQDSLISTSAMVKGLVVPTKATLTCIFAPLNSGSIWARDLGCFWPLCTLDHNELHCLSVTNTA